MLRVFMCVCVYLYVGVCVCVYVCVRVCLCVCERERERERVCFLSPFLLRDCQGLALMKKDGDVRVAFFPHTSPYRPLRCCTLRLNATFDPE